MPQYLITIYHPTDYDPSKESAEMERDIDALNEEMVAAGARFFAGGLHPASRAKSMRAKPGGKVVVTDGPYLETKEHIGGFWILDAANLDKAVAWGKKRRQSPAVCRWRCGRFIRWMKSNSSVTGSDRAAGDAHARRLTRGGFDSL